MRARFAGMYSLKCKAEESLLPIEAFSEGQPMPQEQAARISRSWLVRLGIARTESVWKLARPPIHGTNGTYWSQWISPGKEVTAAAADGTGVLFYLSVRTAGAPGRRAS